MDNGSEENSPHSQAPSSNETRFDRFKSGVSTFFEKLNKPKNTLHDGRPTLEQQLKEARLQVADGERSTQQQIDDHQLASIRESFDTIQSTIDTPNDPNWWVPSYEALMEEDPKKAEKFKKDAVELK